MRRSSYLLLLLLCCVRLVMAQTDFSRLVKQVKPSVVKLTAYNKSDKPIGRATGFVIAGGLLITNSHVIKGAASLRATFADGTYVDADYTLAQDHVADLAVLLLPPSDDYPNELTLAKDTLDIGDRVFIVGNPNGLGWTLSEGIVSALRTFKDVGKRVQMSADISPGSSGSPVFNMKGEVVGIVEGSFRSGQRLNFAIPAETLRQLIETQAIPALERLAAKEKKRNSKPSQPRTTPAIDFSDVAQPLSEWAEGISLQYLSYEYNTKLIKRSADRRVIDWIRIRPNADGYIDGKARTQRIEDVKRAGYSAQGYHNWSHILALYEFDCAKQKYRVFEVNDYDYDGSVLNSVRVRQPPWKDTSLGFTTKRLQELLCK